MQKVVLLVGAEQQYSGAILALRDHGYVVEVQENPEQALGTLQALVPSIIFLDEEIAAGCQPNLCQAVRKLVGLKPIPLVLLTPSLQSERAQQCLAGGVTEILRTPVDPQELLLRCSVLCTQQDAARVSQRIALTLEEVLLSASDGILVEGAPGEKWWCSSAGQQILGLSTAMVSEQKLHRAFSTNQQETECDTFGQLIQLWRQESTTEVCARGADGETLHIELSLSLVGAGLSSRNLLLFKDVSKQKRIEHQLGHSEHLLSFIINCSQAVIYVKDREGKYLLTNQKFTELFGIEKESVVGKFDHQIFPPEIADQFVENDRLVIQRGESMQIEESAQQVDGVHTYVSIKFPIHNESAELIGVGGISTDITDRKRMEQRLLDEKTERQKIEVELRHAQKLEAVGQLAAGIAHEINTPAQFVGDNNTFLKGAFEDLLQLVRAYQGVVGRLAGDRLEVHQQIAELEEDADLEYLQEEVPKALLSAEDGIGRISSIVRAMKEFAHPSKKDKTVADVNKAILNTLTIARNEYKYVADVETDLGEIPLVPCHIGDLNQVFLNLVVNAAHAIKEKNGEAGERGRIVVSSRVRDDQLVIQFADNGCGVEEHLQKRIFDPFFTTKKVGQGTGQGLALAYSIVNDKHRGRLLCDSTKDAGARFTIVLPLDGDPRQTQVGR